MEERLSMDDTDFEFVGVKVESAEVGLLSEENENNLETDYLQSNYHNKRETFATEVKIQEVDACCTQSSLNEEFILPDSTEQNEFRGLNSLSHLYSEDSPNFLLGIKVEKEVVSATEADTGSNVHFSDGCIGPSGSFVKEIEEENDKHGERLGSERYLALFSFYRNYICYFST